MRSGSEGMTEEEEHKFWAQMIRHGDNEKRMLKGGHGVPLSGKSRFRSRLGLGSETGVRC